MAIDPNISLQVGNNVRPLDPLTAYGQVLTLKNAIDAQRLNSLQYDRTQRAMDDEEAVRGAYAVTPDGQVDETTTIRNLVTRGLGPQAVEVRNKFSTDRLANQKAEREAEKARLEAIFKKNQVIGQELAALGPEPTYASAMDAGLRLIREHGLQFDLNEIPQDPAKLAAFVRDRAMRAVEVDKQIAERRAALEPKTELGRLLRDRELYGQRRPEGNSAADRPLVGEVTDMPGGGLRLPGVTGMPPADPFGPAIARASQGEADQAFYYDNQGQVQPRQIVQDQRIAERKAGAPVNTVRVEGPRVELGKPAMGKVDEGLLDTSAALMRMDRIGKNYRPEWSEFGTQAGMKLSGMAERYLGVKMDPKKKESFQQYTAWRRNTLDNLNKGIKEATGSAMGAAEAERIIASMPSPDDSPSEFQQKLDDTVSQYRMAMARFTYIKRQGGNMSIEDVPLEKMPDIMRARDAELEAASLRKYPDMDKSERDRLIKRQLAQEFGLVYK